MEHAEERLGVKAGGTTTDGVFTLEDVECLAACTEAPALQVNYRYRYKVTPSGLDRLLDDLRAGRLDGEIPPHGTLRPRAPEGGAGAMGRHRHRSASEGGCPMSDGDRQIMTPEWSRRAR